MIERLVLTNARLIDGVTPGVIAGASVTIEGGRIAEVLDGRRSPATHDARVIDLRGAYLLPGLWDVHVHLEWPRVPQAGVPELTAQYLGNAQRALVEAGVTGLRMAGTPHFIDVALKRAFDTGQHVGPRLFTCGCRDDRSRQAGRSDRRARQPARRHRQRAHARPRVQGWSARRRPPEGARVTRAG